MTENASANQMTVEDIQDWLATQIAEELGVDPDEIDMTSGFSSFGLNSMQVMNIANLGKQHLGLEISPIVIWSYPNIESLSEYIAEELEKSEVEMFEF